MDLNIVVIIALLGLNVFQLMYWSRQTHKLINKLMSRTYFEYKEAQKLEPKSIKIAEVVEEKPDLRIMDDYLKQMM